MRVERISFTGFRSLRDLTLELGDVTVITGPNNAGKSNVLAGLAFVGDVFTRGLDAAMQTVGGYDSIAFRRAGEPVDSVTFEVTVMLDPPQIWTLLGAFRSDNPLPDDRAQSYEVSLSFTVRRVVDGPVASYALGGSQLRLSDNALISLLSRETNLVWRGDESGIAEFDIGESLAAAPFGRLTAPLRPPLVLGHSTLAGAFADLVRTSVGGLRMVQPVPHLCRRPGVHGPNVLLGPYGENLPSAAEHMRGADPEAWSQVQAAMAFIVPGLTRIDVVSTDESRLALRFFELGAKRAWTAGEVSDGTIQALALIVALFDARIPLLGVEEPENSLHPWILREYAKLCRRRAGRQVILTTHSPVLVDYVPGEWVQVMWREARQSRIGRMLDLVDADARKVWENGETSLFELYDSGEIPRATPGGSGDA